MELIDGTFKDQIEAVMNLQKAKFDQMSAKMKAQHDELLKQI